MTTMAGKIEISDKSLGGEFSRELYTKTDVRISSRFNCAILNLYFQIFIAGGGPIGATLAKQFIDAGYEVRY